MPNGVVFKLFDYELDASRKYIGALSLFINIRPLNLLAVNAAFK
jgi:hypothetical protein